MTTYVSKNGEQTGPHESSEIEESLKKGTFSYSDFAWQEGMTEWKPLSLLFPESAPIEAFAAAGPPPIPVSNSAPTAPTKKNKIPAIVISVIVGLFLLNSLSKCGGSEDSGDENTEGNSVTVGSSSGDYQNLSARKLESRAMEYANKKVEVEMDVGMSGAVVSQNYQRLNIKPSTVGSNGVRNIDVIIGLDSPLYDRVVDLNPKFGDHMTIRGTAKMYTNSYDKIYIDPDQITFTPKEEP